MENLWFISNFSRDDGTVTIKPACPECDISKISNDINVIASLAVDHKVISFAVMTDERSEQWAIAACFGNSANTLDTFISAFCEM